MKGYNHIADKLTGNIMLQYRKQPLSVLKGRHTQSVSQTIYLDPLSCMPSIGVRGSTCTLFGDILPTHALSKAVTFSTVYSQFTLHIGFLAKSG